MASDQALKSSQFSEFQLEIYFDGLDGRAPQYPVDFASLERKAAEALPSWVYSYVAGGCGDEHTQRANVSAFQHWGLVPRMLNGAYDRDLTTSLVGVDLPSPLLMAPIGVIGLCAQDFHGDIHTAQASAGTGVPMIASTLTMDAMEDVAPNCGDTPTFFQLYTPNDPELAASLVNRAERAGYRAIVVTLDTWTNGWRPRDLNTGNYPQLRGYALANFFTDDVFLRRLDNPPHEDLKAATREWVNVRANSLQWDDLPWLRGLTDLPILLKGICHPDDARRALDCGMDGIYCSNHGGRQANGGLAAIDLLPDVVRAAGDKPVVFDSGVRSGSDVAKALALGATAVAVGRPYAYALAVGGADGVAHQLRSILAELDLLMAINGFPTIAELRNADIRRA